MFEPQVRVEHERSDFLHSGHSTASRVAVLRMTAMAEYAKLLIMESGGADRREGMTSIELDDLRVQFMRDGNGLSEVLFVDEDVPDKPIL